jgi:hypothetical protein
MSSYRNLLETTIGAEPPTRLDVDELMAASRHRLRRRRWAVTSCGAAVLAVAVLAALVVAPPTEPMLDPTTTAATAATPMPTLAGPPPTEDPQLAKARLAEAMRAAVTDAVPGVHLGGAFEVRHNDIPTAQLPDGVWFRPAYYYEAEQVLDADGVHGVIVVSVSRRLGSEACPVVSQATPAMTCQSSTGPHGELVVLTHHADLSGGATLLRTIVRVERPDGSAVLVGTSNAVGLDPVGPVTGGEPPLTVAQLTTIALDPRLTLYPEGA